MSRAVANAVPQPMPAGDAPSPHHLAPPGASPAGDLQRRLAQAALQGFYAPRRAPGWQRKRRLAAMVLAGALSWAVVFGAWNLLPVS